MTPKLKPGCVTFRVNILVSKLISSRHPLTNSLKMHSSQSHLSAYLIVTIHGLPALQWGPSISNKVLGKIDPI